MKTKMTKLMACLMLAASGSYGAAVFPALLNPPMFLLGITNHTWQPASNYLAVSRVIATNAASLDLYNTNWIVTNLNRYVANSNIMLPWGWSLEPSNNAWLQDAGPINPVGRWGSTNLPAGIYEVSWDVARGQDAGTFNIRPELWISVTNLSTNREYVLARGTEAAVLPYKSTLKHTISMPTGYTLTNNLHQLILLRMCATQVRGTNYMSLYLGGTNSFIRTPQSYQITTAITNMNSNCLSRPVLVAGTDFSISIVGRGTWAGNNTTNWLAAGFQVSPDGKNWSGEFSTNNLIWHLTSPMGSNLVCSYSDGTTVVLGTTIVDSTPTYISAPFEYIKLAWITNGLPGAATNPFHLTNVYIITRPRL